MVTNDGSIDSMEEIITNKPIKAWLTDMDGVLVHEDQAIPGAADFIAALRETGTPFLVLTNNSIYTPRDLSWRLHNSGIEVPEANIWTSAMATASFLRSQTHRDEVCTAYVIGEAGLTTALHEAGVILTDRSPKYVVLGETRNYSFSQVTTAVRLIEAGSKFILTNPDVSGPSEQGTLPAAGAVAAMLTEVTGMKPLAIGKPNSIMFRAGLNLIGAHSETTAMVGDNMQTDVLTGIEAGLETFMTLTGVSQESTPDKYAYAPDHIIDSVADLVPVVNRWAGASVAAA